MIRDINKDQLLKEVLAFRRSENKRNDGVAHLQYRNLSPEDVVCFTMKILTENNELHQSEIDKLTAEHERESDNIVVDLRRAELDSIRRQSCPECGCGI